MTTLYAVEISMMRKKPIIFRVRLPKPEHTRLADQNSVYDIEVLKRDAAGITAKMHYVGYSSRYNEWQSVSELIVRSAEAHENKSPQLQKEFT